MDPASVMASIDADARALDVAGRELGAAIKVLQGRELAYEEVHQKTLLAIYHEHKESGERLPAEELRRALAHQRMDRHIYAHFLEAKAQVNALQAYIGTLKASVSARQSLLSALRTEAMI